MIKVSFEFLNGETREIDANPGNTVMEVARNAGFPEINAECGGSAACGTCHVYLVQGNFAEPTQQETDMLEFVAAEQLPESRLSCQLVLRDEVSVVKVRLPEIQ